MCTRFVHFLRFFLFFIICSVNEKCVPRWFYFFLCRAKMEARMKIVCAVKLYIPFTSVVLFTFE